MIQMTDKPTYEELEQLVKQLEKEVVSIRQIEKSLRENEATIGSIFLAAPTGIGVVCDRVIQQANERLCELLGYSTGELLGKSSRILYPTDEDFEYVGREKYSQIRERKFGTVETRWLRKDGSIIDVLLSSAPIDPKDLSIGVTFTALDITSRKQVEKDLRESEERYKSLFKNNHSVMLLIDPETGDIVDANAAAVSFYGWAYNALTRMKISDINTMSEEQVFGVMEKAKMQQRNHFYFRHRLASGEIRDVEVYSGPIKVHGRELLYSIVHDITARKKAEEALKESEEKFRYISEQSLLAIQIIQDDVFKYVNQASADISGYSVDELMGWKPGEFGKLIHPDDREFVMDQALKKQKGEKNIFSHYQFRSITKTGETKWLEVYSRTIPYNGKFADLGTLIDITEKKKAEEEKAALESQLLQAQKMESIGTLTGGIAHDFNNLLSIILGNTEIAMEDAPEWHPAKHNLNEIRTACLRARDVVKQLLSFSRKIDPKQEPVKLVQITKDTLKFLRATIPTDIEIRQNIPEDINDTIFADCTQINQVMINLFTNAAHAMENTGGVITIGIENIYLDQNSADVYPDLSPGNYVKITVSDTGSGIGAEIKDRIFDPYFTTKEVGKGTGIGLSVVHGIVKSHNGAISVDSEPGKGTIFSIYFPLAGEEAVTETETEEELPTGSEKILLVDDEESIINIERQRLERLGYKVKARTDPRKALELFRSDPDQFDLVITDMTMPHITGDNLLKEILNIRPDIPTILCTGFSERIDEEKAKEIGVRRYIQKPFDKYNLSILVRQVLDHP
jgi:two-component system cell cycle sensor histidine kinase/response regulator CckA